MGEPRVKEEVETEVRKKPDISKKTVIILIVLTISALVFYEVYNRVSDRTVVAWDTSMSPTIEKGSKLYIKSLWDVGRDDLDRFSVVGGFVVEESHWNEDGELDEEGESFLSRIIAFEGERVEYKDETLYVDGREFVEPFLEEKLAMYEEDERVLTNDFTLADFGEQVVPDGHIFVLSDNRNVGGDSRDFGFVPKNDINYLVQGVYYPFNKMKFKFYDEEDLW